MKGVFVRELARALLPYADVEVCAPVSYFPILRSRRGVSHRSESGGLKIRRPRYLAVPTQLFGQRWRLYTAALRRALAAEPKAPRLLHVHWTYPDGYAAVRVAKELGIPTVMTVHGHAAMGFFDPPARRRYFGEPLRAAARVIAVSEELKRELVGMHAVAAEKIDVIHNGYSPEKFAPGAKTEARRALGLPVAAKIVLTIARLSEEKRLDLLIEAASRCSADVHVYIVGDGPLEKAFRQQIAERGLAERVHLQGAIPHEQLGAWLRAADVFCLPSQNEGCPVVVHEALACGRPVIATRVGAIPDVIASEAHGLLVVRNDIEELTRALQEGLARSWDENEIARYGSQYTWDAIARQTVRVYEQALAAN